MYVRVTVEYETATTVRNLKQVNATELRLWKRRLKRIGGSLSSETVTGGFATQTERIVITVPTAGSDTFLLQNVERRNGSHTSSRRGSLQNGGGLSATRENSDVRDHVLSSPSGSGSRPETPEGDLGQQLEHAGRHPELRTRPKTIRDEEGGRAPNGDILHDSITYTTIDSVFDSIEGAKKVEFRILYIEDERVQAYFFINKCRRVFGDQCTVVHETDGVAALERLQKGEQYNIIVSDIFMAGMDGVSFFRTLFSSNLNTGRLHVEGLDEQDLRMNIILTGADIMPGLCEDEDLAEELASLYTEFGVLVYNKTSGVGLYKLLHPVDPIA
jgi:CheY-like chemotaxis protein